MSFYIDMRVVNGEEVAEYLKEIGFDLATKRMRAALRKAAVPIYDEMLTRAPEGDGPARAYGDPPQIHEPGEMKRSIKISTRIRDRGETINALIGPHRNAFYAKYTEFGTRSIAPMGWAHKSMVAGKDKTLEEFTRSITRSMKLYRTKQAKLRR